MLIVYGSDTMKTIKVILLKLGLLTPLILLASLSYASDNLRIFPLDNYPQSASYWLNLSPSDGDTLLMSNSQQQQKFTKFKDNYYGKNSPWSVAFIAPILHKKTDSLYLYNTEVAAINEFTNQDESQQNAGYAMNFRPYSSKWSQEVSDNMQLNQFKNLSFSAMNMAIAVANLQVKSVPTDDPWFLSSNIAGEGYPFDLNQLSSTYIGTPIYIAGHSKDGQWVFVITPGIMGWAKASNIAKVSQEFAQDWASQANKGLMAIIQTRTGLVTSGNILGYTYIGTVLPLVKASSDSYSVAVPQKNINGWAVELVVNIPLNAAVKMPLLATPDNFIRIISQLQNRPYAWGGLGFYNDCSAELKALFTPFGYFLPRNSQEQSLAGRVVSLTKLSAPERMAYLVKNGKPFMTLIHIKGHIMLYLGNKVINGVTVPVTYQDLWGLRPEDNSYRNVIGQSVYFPLLLQYPEDTNAVSLLDRDIFELVFL